MAKLKNVIKQLSEKDYQAVYDSMIETNAEKSAYLMKAIRERQLSDKAIMEEMGVSKTAYYTMRSRLNIKIEERLLEQMGSPRTDLLRKVANLNEVLFTKKRTIALATLKKLEKELVDYDLANELTVVYKALKKIHINSPEYFAYSQLYNRHVAYMLAVDKAEDMLAEYFKKYGMYILTGDQDERMGLVLLMREMQNVAHLYKSHRLYVYQSCMHVFHRLFVETEELLEGESLEDIFGQVQSIFQNYKLDPLYYHLHIVFEFLQMEYYNHYKVYRESQKFVEEIDDALVNLLVNYPHYTFSAQVFITRLQRSLRQGKEKKLHEENKELLRDYEPYKHDMATHAIYTQYLALSSFYLGKYEETTRILNTLLTEINIKKYPFLQFEIKSMLALQYCLLNDFEMLNGLATSIQRQLRLFGKNSCLHVSLFIRILRIAVSVRLVDKEKQIAKIARKIESLQVPHFVAFMYVRMDQRLIKKITRIN